MASSYKDSLTKCSRINCFEGEWDVSIIFDYKIKKSNMEIIKVRVDPLPGIQQLDSILNINTT